MAGVQCDSVGSTVCVLILVSRYTSEVEGACSDWFVEWLCVFCDEAWENVLMHLFALPNPRRGCTV